MRGKKTKEEDEIYKRQTWEERRQNHILWKTRTKVKQFKEVPFDLRHTF